MLSYSKSNSKLAISLTTCEVGGHNRNSHLLAWNTQQTVRQRGWITATVNAMVLIYANSKQDTGQPCVMTIAIKNGQRLHASNMRKYFLHLTRKYRGRQSVEKKEMRARTQAISNMRRMMVVLLQRYVTLAIHVCTSNAPLWKDNLTSIRSTHCFVVTTCQKTIAKYSMLSTSTSKFSGPW